jgi:hypothetical protein
LGYYRNLKGTLKLKPKLGKNVTFTAHTKPIQSKLGKNVTFTAHTKPGSKGNILTKFGLNWLGMGSKSNILTKF